MYSLLVVRRKADAVGLVQLVGHLVHLPGLWIDAIHRFLDLGLRLEPFVVAQNSVGRVGEPDCAIGMRPPGRWEN